MSKAASAPKSLARIVARLEPYWKMEAANMVGVPAMAGFFTKGQIGWVSLVPLLATVLLLGIGAVYWRAKVRQMRRVQIDQTKVLGWIDRLQWPSLILTALGGTAAALGWLVPGLTRGTPDRIAATVLAVLAGLEYVNYYHRQLQHFDNRADFRRMLAGKGFRTSWLARDLAMLRRERSPHQ